jgi:ferredoxin
MSQGFLSKQIAAQVFVTRQQHDKALKAYDEAIEMTETENVTNLQLYQLYQKRSQSLLNLGRHDEAIGDANKALNYVNLYTNENVKTGSIEELLAANHFLCFKNVVYAYVNKGDVLEGAKKIDEAKEAYQTALNLCQTMNMETMKQIQTLMQNMEANRKEMKRLIDQNMELTTIGNRDVVPRFDHAQSLIVAREYQIDTQNTSIQVQWVNIQHGKEVFAKKDFNIGEEVLKEEPIVSQRVINSSLHIETCERCMRCINMPTLESVISLLNKNELNAVLESVREQYEAVSQPVSCQDCGVKYCSSKCQTLAKKHYHKLLCKQEGIKELTALATELGRTNPLLILK